LLKNCKGEDIKNLNYAVNSALINKETYEYQYQIIWSTAKYAFLFEELSSSDYYADALLKAINQILETVGVSKRFHEQNTNDQTCLFFYGTAKSLAVANKQYKLFKARKKR